MTIISYCSESQTTVEKIETRDSVNVTISWRQVVLLRLLLKKERKCTDQGWNRGETPDLWLLSLGARIHVPGDAARLHLSRDRWEQERFHTGPMATPPISAQDWPLSPSVEGRSQLFNVSATPSLVDGQQPRYSNAPTPPLYIDSQGRQRWSRSISVVSQELQPQTLTFVQLRDWDRESRYDEVPPTCIHYSIEWKVMVNRKVILKDTEQDIVLEPAAYWQSILQPRLEELLREKILPPRAVRADDTEVVVSVTKRAERDLVKQFKATNIKWSVVREQLIAWSDLFERGKKLRVNICTRYVDIGPAAGVDRVGSNTRRAGKSATQNQLAERGAQIDAEEATTGQPSAWRDVYALMRCPGPPCTYQPWCWRDSLTNKRYKLKTHHLRALVNYVEKKNKLYSHDDIPEDLRQQIYREEESTQSKQLTTASSNVPSIQITNVLPSHASPEPEKERRPEGKHLLIPGLRDVAVQDYCEWQQSQVRDESLKAEFQNAGNVVVAEGYDLEQINEDQDPEFLIKQGVKRGIARRFVNDIENWAKRRKHDDVEESV